MTTYRKKLIEVALPLDAINAASAREKSIRHGHPSTLHLWWARRPLAAARAVLFGQLVDDPSAWPERFATEAEQEKERQRLFGIIERLVPWEASNDERVLNEARLEIARSWARSHPSAKAEAVLVEGVTPDVVNDYLATELPPVHDPFAGGGTIPLEAQRLGLRAIATDLNPVAVLINKALIEIPPAWQRTAAVHPEPARKLETSSRRHRGGGLADDVRYYAALVAQRAADQLGTLYPQAAISDEPNAEKQTPLAWIWARTIECPNPACRTQTPLVRSFWLATKRGRERFIDYSLDRSVSPPEVRYSIGSGRAAPEASIGRTGARCLACDAPIALESVREAGRRQALRPSLLACVVDTGRGRLYLPPTAEQRAAAEVEAPADLLDTDLPQQALGFRVQAYGLVRHRDLFTPRQLLMLATFAKEIDAVRSEIERDFAVSNYGRRDEGKAYAHAVTLYLGLGLSRMANYASCLCYWSSHAKDELVKQVFRDRPW